MCPRSIARVPPSRALPGFPITAHHLCAFLITVIGGLIVCSITTKKKGGGFKQAGGQPVHRTYVSGYLHSSGGQFHILPVVFDLSSWRSTSCAGDGVGGDLITWWGEAWNEVQAAFPTFILGRMDYCLTCRVVEHHTDTTLRPAFDESIEMCVWHHSVDCATGVIVKCCHCFICDSSPYSTAAGGPKVEVMSVVLLRRIAISREIHSSTLCIDMLNTVTVRSFTRESNTYIFEGGRS